MTAIMLTGVVGLSSGFIPSADAAKGNGVYLPATGSSSGICGLMLCSDYPGGQEAYGAEWSSTFMNKIETVPSTTDKYESKVIPVSAHNVDEEYPAQLDVFIHKFELDKISADEALDGINEIHEHMFMQELQVTL